MEWRRPSTRHTAEQYACPRSHAAQIVKGRAHRRQVRSRSGVSMRLSRRAREPQNDEAGRAPWHNAHGGRDWSRGRVCHEDPELLTPGPHPHLSRPVPYPTNPGGRWTLPRLWTHRPRPQPLGNLAGEREIPTSAHSPSSLSLFRKDQNGRRLSHQRLSRFTRFLGSADTGLHRSECTASG